MQEIKEINLGARIAESTRLVKSIFSEELTKKQLDLIMCIISMVRKEDDHFYTYVIPLKELKKIICPSNPRTIEVKEVLKKSVKGLKKACFTIQDENSDTYYSWIEMARLDWKKETLTIRLSEDVAQFYLRLQDHFLVYQLENILKLSTITQTRIYQWAYSKKDFKNDVSITVEDAKEFFGCKNVRTVDFTRKYLEPALKVINDRTDLNIKYEKVKADKQYKQKITSLKFTIECDYQKPKKVRTLSQQKNDKEKSLAMWKENKFLDEKNTELIQEKIRMQEEIEKLKEENAKLKEKSKDNKDLMYF